MLKLAGFCCVLACIAWLGERSRGENVYGQEIEQHDVHPEPVRQAEVPLAQVNTAPPPVLPAAPAPPPVPAPCTPASASNEPSRPTSAVLADGRLVLNEATAQELDRLPGIGQKRAEEIVALRARLGRFKRLADLLRIRGIGPRSLVSLQQHLVLDRPPVADSTADLAEKLAEKKSDLDRPDAKASRPK